MEIIVFIIIGFKISRMLRIEYFFKETNLISTLFYVSYLIISKIFEEIINFMEQQIQKIATRLKELRIEKGYGSYEFFVWEHKIPRVQYWRMEKGNNFTIKSLLRVLNAHEMTLQEFFNSIEN